MKFLKSLKDKVTNLVERRKAYKDKLYEESTGKWAILTAAELCAAIALGIIMLVLLIYLVLIAPAIVVPLIVFGIIAGTFYLWAKDTKKDGTFY